MRFNEFVALHARQAIITALLGCSFTSRLTRPVTNRRTLRQPCKGEEVKSELTAAVLMMGETASVTLTTNLFMVA